MSKFLRDAYEMYRDGFRSMTIGRYLWAIVIVKLLVMFLVLKLFFFPDILRTRYDDDASRAEAVRDALAPARKSAVAVIIQIPASTTISATISGDDRP